MSVRELIGRIAGYRASLWEETPSEADLQRELAETSAAAEFGKGGFAPLPESILRLSNVLADPYFRTKDAVGALDSDPALAVDVLRLANSAAFIGRSPCRSTADAFNRLGATRVKDLVVSSYLEGLGASMSGYSRIAFDHSIRVAKIARALPANAGCTPDRLYLCGLVHDIGITLLDQSGEFTYYTGHYEDDDVQCAAERSVLGFDHATLGAVAAELWGLPHPISALLFIAEDLERLTGGTDQLSEADFERVAASSAGQLMEISAAVLQSLWSERVVGKLHTKQSARSAA
jgi:HD-like signal output (HDOD) protein